MKTKLKIALVAHDQRKADMVDWALNFTQSTISALRWS